MFTVTVESSFTASHQITYAKGQKEDLHEHRWLLKVAVSSPQLDENGLALDFIDLKADIDRITAELDNTRLENLDFFKDKNASAENVAKHIHDSLKPAIPADKTLDYVEVMEAEGCWAKYSQ